jgi:hypothetical protein
MKVKDLIDLLKEYDENAEVVLQEDDEGNGYRRIRGADEDSELQTDDETYFLSHYENIDMMSEEFDADVYEILAVLVDVVVLY